MRSRTLLCQQLALRELPKLLGKGGYLHSVEVARCPTLNGIPRSIATDAKCLVTLKREGRFKCVICSNVFSKWGDCSAHLESTGHLDAIIRKYTVRKTHPRTQGKGTQPALNCTSGRGRLGHDLRFEIMKICRGGVP